MSKRLLGHLTLAVGLLGSIGVRAEKPTNIIVILMDDMGYGDLRVNGATGYATPNIDRMVQNGMLFTHFYAPQAVSGASRAGLMTGCYPNRIGMFGAPGPNSKIGINENETTIAEMLRHEGYATAIYGKWHLGDHAEFLPTRHGFDEFYGIPYSNDMWPNHPTAKYPDLPLIQGDRTIELNPDQSRFTTNFTNRTLEFIDKNKKRPFFIYLAHPMPHVPLFVSDRFKGKSKQGLYGDVMMEIDWSVGAVLDKLKKEGLDKNTLVVLVSDNGPWLNYGNHAGSSGGLREGKGTSFEGGQRVPCIMQWTGVIPSGAVCDKMASAIDLLPTFSAISNAKLPDVKIDGVDIMPLLKDDPTANPRTSFYYYYRVNDLEAVSDGQYKLIFPHTYRCYENFVPGDDGRPGKVEEYYRLNEKMLIDLRRDPGERYNVIGQHLDVVERLERMANEAREDLGDNLTGDKGKNCRSAGRIGAL